MSEARARDKTKLYNPTIVHYIVKRNVMKITDLYLSDEMHSQ